jgi:hypothetical protein
MTDLVKKWELKEPKTQEELINFLMDQMTRIQLLHESPYSYAIARTTIDRARVAWRKILDGNVG